MGVSLDQAARIFIELEPLHRERLLTGLRDHAAGKQIKEISKGNAIFDALLALDYGLPRYSFPSFTRRLTPKLQVSAADVVRYRFNTIGIVLF